ncbi:hypothetical protein T439DRAFT_332212 [Meredithblackwellia eburnea MCA 4105]
MGIKPFPLPDELLYDICQHLPSSSLFHVTLVNSRWRQPATVMLYRSLILTSTWPRVEAIMCSLLHQRDLRMKRQCLDTVLMLPLGLEHLDLENANNNEVQESLDILFHSDPSRHKTLKSLAITSTLNTLSSPCCLSEELFMQRLSWFSNIQNLTLGDVAVDATNFTKRVKPSYRLRTLHLHNMELSPDFLEFILGSSTEKKTLNQLRLTEMRGLDEIAAGVKEWAVELKQLEIRRTEVTPLLATFIQNLPRLESLKVLGYLNYKMRIPCYSPPPSFRMMVVEEPIAGNSKQSGCNMGLPLQFLAWTHQKIWIQKGYVATYYN